MSVPCTLTSQAMDYKEYLEAKQAGRTTAQPPPEPVPLYWRWWYSPYRYVWTGAHGIVLLVPQQPAGACRPRPWNGSRNYTHRLPALAGPRFP